MKNRNCLKGLGITMIAATLILTGCGNGDAEKIDTVEQTKSVEEDREKVKIESNEGKPQHEHLITVKLPPEADFLNDETLEVYEKDKKKYDQTNQLITNNSVTILLGDFCYYEPAWSSLTCSAILVNGTDTNIEDLSFKAEIMNKPMSGKIFSDDKVPELTKAKTGKFQPNEGIPIILVFSEENPKNEENAEPQKINIKDIKVKIKDIQYKAVNVKEQTAKEKT
ncbi:hypothetical protein HCB33_11660 [Listeria sp. FSL L7-0233]|uniref:hypothetical protein n=1 Tax=Listeria cossartiae TaxID=2838249 RepID=UPI0016296FAF|nr:hypothetical protein [Listeria cossartiae]MBC2184013.1 hypothetical protein [Listeria cossartiae subsp. cossartiae]MBC2192275.1 hypothetical protein [Listeria cossartiae subsp. cossartiae]